MSDFISRGFGGSRREREEHGDRLPPGQYAESGFPVLHQTENATKAPTASTPSPGRSEPHAHAVGLDRRRSSRCGEPRR